VDLHVVAPLASPAERAAVDAVLDPEIGPTTGWSGGPRNTNESHMARGGHVARSRRDLLLPALHAVQSRIGWISQPALGYICRRLTVPPAEAYGVATFYALFATRQRPPDVAHVCDDIACRLAGAEETCAALERQLGPAGTPARDGQVTWLRSPCLGLCERAPAALFTIAGERPRTFTASPVDAVGVINRLDDARAGFADEDAAPSPGSNPDIAAIVPQAVDEHQRAGLRLLGRVGRVDPTSLADYRASGGYQGLTRALAMGAGKVVEEVTTARLLGRGGAAFPTGRKWAAVASQPVQPHYLVCNADESEPGTFKDRVLLEHDPFALIEGMTIEAFATGASHGYVYLRGEYPLAAERLAAAIVAARGAALLGPDVDGSGFAFDIEIRRGAGAYICGEETALFESIEGGRGEPRNKPPFPVEVGLFGKPTAVNNVETLVNVPLILRDGGEAFAAIGTEGSTGPKLFCLSGHVGRPGVYEVPFGTTLRELIDLAGGVQGPDAERQIRTILLGGAAGSFVGADVLDTPLTFEGTRAIGASLGSGVVMVFDRSTDLVDILRRIAAFFRDESCGQCVPCRVGTVRQEELLARLAAGTPRGSTATELGLLREIGQAMRDASICGLGQTASTAIESAFRAELVAL
jgi:NADH-quinone oxidoreductase subunit F